MFSIDDVTDTLRDVEPKLRELFSPALADLEGTEYSLDELYKFTCVYAHQERERCEATTAEELKRWMLELADKLYRTACERLGKAARVVVDTVSNVVVNMRARIISVFATVLLPVSARYDSEDLYSDVAIKALENQGKCRGITTDEISGWVARIAHNTAMSALAHHLAQCRDISREEVGGDPDGCPAGLRTAEQVAITNEMIARVEATIDLLAPRQREAVLMRFIDGASNTEMGEALGCTPPAAACLVSAGLRKLRKLLPEE